jgi:hypothetical protein
MRTAFFEGARHRPVVRWGLVVAVVLGAWLSLGSDAALASGEAHPKLGEFGSFSNPNGIAIDESSGDVYVADIATNTVYKFDASGNPVDFFALGSTNALTGTPAGPFSFPASASGTPAAIAVDNSKSSSDPSAGDLYVMDAGHGAIDKFSPSGEYLNQITGFAPATGSPADHELLGLAVDANGDVRVDTTGTIESNYNLRIDVFDDFSTNRLLATQLNSAPWDIPASGVPDAFQKTYGFAASATGDDYLLFASCSCTVKLGQQLASLGRVDKAASGDVAVAGDPATGHIYVDDQSSIAEWDTGAMNGSVEGNEQREGPPSAGVLVGGSFGSLSGSSGQGGIAVNGSTGEIYVSDPGAGKVDVFGSATPAVTAGKATGVSKEAASLNGTVDPRGVRVTACQFDYGIADEFGRGKYLHTVPCTPSSAEIDVGTSPVPVSAKIEGLKPGLLYRFRLIAGDATGSNETSGLFATEGVGFGIKSFEVSFLNEDGTPDTQAGSHPYKLVNTIVFNSHFMRGESNADSAYVKEPDGTLKDLALDLPPGFVGDPNATPKKCTLRELLDREGPGTPLCSPESLVGYWSLEFSKHIPFGTYQFYEPIYNIVPPRGVALLLGVLFEKPDLFISNRVQAGGDYPVRATVINPPAAAPVLVSQVTVFGVAGSGQQRKPFLTLPTNCHGPLRSSITVDSYQEPDRKVETSNVTRNSAGTPVSLTGCSKLLFPPEISVSADSSNASTSSGLTVKVHVPQTAALNPDGLGESALRDTTVTLPEGVALNPAGGDGLQACSEGLAGFTGVGEFNSEYEPGVKTATFTPELANPLLPGVNFCPNGSKIGTVKIKTQLLEHELEGAVYLAAQNANPFGSLLAMYMIIEDPYSGSLVKLAGELKLTSTGQIVTTFKNTPDIPFEDLELHFFGGERAPLTTPSRCGTYTTQAVFVPWDGNGPVAASSSFKIEHGPNGTPCPGASLPFDPSLAAGTTSIQAGGFSPFTMTMSREDGQQNLQAISLKMPPGLSGTLTGVELCPEAQANAGTCSSNSLIGETIVSVGVGNDPFTVKGGRVYLTGPYKGAPFGLSIVNPAKAGPLDVEKDTSNPSFDPGCDCIVVRAKIEVDPTTADLTITTDNEGPYKIPTILDGIPLQIQHVNVTINRPRFTFNPTNCEPMGITGALDSTEGGTSLVSVPFQVTNCARMSFKPHFSVSTSGRTSRHSGASLHVRLSYAQLPFGDQANIRSVKVDLPKQLPSRLETLKKACVDTVFDQDPAACPAASRVGYAKATTPIVPVPLEGPAYFVSHGGAKFPELIVVLQGYGVTVYLHGETFISKGITSSTFHTIPDVPVGTFELTLPQGHYSALAANGNLCTTKLIMPTYFAAQNGMTIHQSTPIATTGCVKHKTHKRHKTRKHKTKHKKKK